MKRKKTLEEKYPPSNPCNCDICKNYCKRPGWWTVKQAENAIKAGYASRMMIEISPEIEFAVISPAFKGNEGRAALNKYASNSCTFFINGLCELHSTEHIPLECRYCHHERKGMGIKCHLDIEKEWNTERGKILVRKWGRMVGICDKVCAKK